MFHQRNKFFRFFFLISIILFLIAACNRRPKDVLSKKEMVKVLTDFHLLDGVLYAKDSLYIGNYNTYYYQYVLKKHGITQAQFDSSLAWYGKNPREFEKVYTDVILRLNHLQEDIKKGKYHPNYLETTKTNLWYLPTHYLLTKDFIRRNLLFKIQRSDLLFNDIYELKILQRIAPEDSCENRYMVLRIHYANGEVDSISHIAYNDSLLRRYTFRLRAKQPYKIDLLTGSLLNSIDCNEKLNVEIDSVSLIREFVPLWQDSLRKIVNKNDFLFPSEN